MTASASEILKLFEVFGQAFGIFGPTIFGLIVLWMMFSRAPRGGATPEAETLAELRAIRESLGKIHAALGALETMKDQQAALAAAIGDVKSVAHRLDGRLSGVKG